MNPEYKNLTKIPYFRRVVLQNFPFIEEDFDALTDYGLLCKVVEYLNKVIEQQNLVNDNTDALYQAYTTLKNYVDNYFDNLDVQELVNNKLDEMAASGELETLIGDYVTNKLDYYLVDNTFSYDEIQNLFNINRTKIIEFKDGNYSFNNTFRLNKNTKIILNNAILTFSNIQAFFNFKNTDEFVSYNGNGNIEIIGGKIVGGSLSFCHSSNIKISNVHFQNCLKDHIIELAAQNNTIIENCIFDGIKEQISSRLFVEYINIDNMNHSNFPHFNENNPTYDETINQNIYINNCEFIKPTNINYFFYSAIGNHTFTNNVYHRGLFVNNNKFVNMRNMGIHLLNFKDCIIENNYFIKDFDYNENLEGSMIRLRNSDKNILIKNNYFKGNFEAIDNRDRNDFDNIHIENNIFEDYLHNNNPMQAVVNIGNSNNVKINNNDFNNCTMTNIFINNIPTASTVVNDGLSYIENNNFNTTNLSIHGILINYGKSHIINNNFNIDTTTSNNCCIRINDNLEDSQVIKNNIFKNSIITVIKDIRGFKGDKSYIYNHSFTVYNDNSASNASLSEHEISEDVTQFNTVYITLSNSGVSQTIKVNPLSLFTKFSFNRRYRIPVCDNDSDSVIVNSFRVTDSTHIDYTNSSSNVKIQRISFVNE